MNTIIEKIRAEVNRQRTFYSPNNPYDKKAIRVCNNILSALGNLGKECEEKPINPEDAMKELDEKIALVKQRGTWDGVDVDKYMDEVRGREPEKPMNQEGLEEEINRLWESFADEMEGPHNLFDIYARLARHFANWQKEQMLKEAVEGEVVTTNKYTSVRYLSRYGTFRYFYGIGGGFQKGDKVKLIIVKED